MLDNVVNGFKVFGTATFCTNGNQAPLVNADPLMLIYGLITIIA